PKTASRLWTRNNIQRVLERRRGNLPAQRTTPLQKTSPRHYELSRHPSHRIQPHLTTRRHPARRDQHRRTKKDSGKPNRNRNLRDQESRSKSAIARGRSEPQGRVCES